MKSYVIIGLGRFGTALALKLQELGNEVMVIDENAEQVQKISNRVTYAVVGDARDEEVLTSLGVRNVDCAVVSVGSDLAASILITLNLKALDVPMVIARRLTIFRSVHWKRWAQIAWSFPSGAGCENGAKPLFLQRARLYRAVQ